MKFSIPVLLICLLYGCKQSEVPVKVQKDIDSIAFKYVPDKREGICDISLKILKDKKLLIKGETNFIEVKKEIMSYMNGSGIEYHDSLLILPDQGEINRYWGLVSVSLCNIRKNPVHSAELVSQAVMGTPVRIIKRNESWLLVQTPDYYLGWTNDSGIRELSKAEIEEWRQSDRLIFTAKSGDILSEKAEKGVVSDIVSGAIVNIISDQGSYYTVKLPDGRRGRIKKTDSGEFGKWCSEIKPEADRLISFAKSVTGSPYLWGGTSTKMADCSGYVKTIYFTGGVILSRDASQQFTHGKEVDISSSFETLQPGDLLFFGSVNSEGKKRITHTGMYIGDTEFIHSSGQVKVNSLDSTRANYSDYLLKMLMGARRIIDTKSERGIEHVALSSWYNNPN